MAARAADDLGVPVTEASVISYRVAPGLGRGGHDLLCWTTTAESGGHFAAMDMASGQTWVHPLDTLEAYPIVLGRDARVYVGTTSACVMRWDPSVDTWEAVGGPLFSVPGAPILHVRCLCQGADGWLYAGSTVGSRARVHPETGQIQPLPPLSEPGNWYASSAAALPDGRIAFGYGHAARLVVFDPARFADVGQWLPDEWLADGFVISLVAGPRVLYAVHFPSGRRGAFATATGRLLGVVPWPPATANSTWSRWKHSTGYGSSLDFYLVPGSDEIIACDGSQVHRFDPTAGRPSRSEPVDSFGVPAGLACELENAVAPSGRVRRLDRRRLRVLEERRPRLPPVERNLAALGVGPDGCIYGGAYQSTLLFRHEPETGVTTVLGDHHPDWSGEDFSYAVRRGELVIGAYTNGALTIYDPKRPWDCDAGRMVNPRLAGFLGQRVYRPFSLAVAADGRVWGVGPAGWGSTGGGLAWCDPDTGRCSAAALPEIPLDLVPLPGGRLLCVSRERLRWWDACRDVQLVDCLTPLPLVGAVALADERVLLAAADELLVADCATPGRCAVLRRHPAPVPCVRALVTEQRAVIGGPDGLAWIDLASGAGARFCSTPLATRFPFAVTREREFFYSGTHLLSAGW